MKESSCLSSYFEMNESGTTAVPRWFTKPNNKWRRLFVTGTEVIN